jgi:O-antigen/teichoic acid export membrane protein
LWTLVLAPLVGFGSRALGTAIAARAFILPSFNFRGARELAQYGGVLTLGQFFWFLQTQADVAIAGRVFDPHALGIYTTSLFLTQLFVNKFVPALNEVAFSAYARVQDDHEAVAHGFLKSLRIITLVGVPFGLGLAAAAEPAVSLVLGAKWLDTVPVIAILGFAMPFMTLQVMFGPTMNALGRPGIYARLSMIGALLLPAAFLIAVHFGVLGMALAWLIGYPLLNAISAIWVLPAVRVTLRQCLTALAPPALGGLAMFAGVRVLDGTLTDMDMPLRLALLVAGGGMIYGGWLFVFSRERLAEVIDLARRRG